MRLSTAVFLAPGSVTRSLTKSLTLSNRTRWSASLIAPSLEHVEDMARAIRGVRTKTKSVVANSRNFAFSRRRSFCNGLGEQSRMREREMMHTSQRSSTTEQTMPPFDTGTSAILHTMASIGTARQATMSLLGCLQETLRPSPCVCVNQSM